MYVSMEILSYNVEISRRSYGYRLQMNSWILYSRVTCHTKPDISDFIPGSLVETDKYFEVADEHFSQQNRQEK